MMPILRTGNPARANLDKIQEQLVRARRELACTVQAPLPKPEIRAALMAACENAVYRSGFLDQLQGFQFAGGGTLPGTGLESLSLPDGKMAWIPSTLRMGDLVTLLGAERVVDLLLERLNGTGVSSGLAAGERAKKVRSLTATTLDLERQEELETLLLEEQGFTVLRRADATPAVLLEVWAGYETKASHETQAA